MVAALRPLRVDHLGLLLQAAAFAPEGKTAEWAADAIGRRDGSPPALEDVEDVYGKLGVAFPEMMVRGPASLGPKAWECPAEVAPSAKQCGTCGQDFDAHRHEYPVRVYTATKGEVEVIATERHCSQCGAYFLGGWNYKSGTTRGFTNLRVTDFGESSPLFILPTSRGHAAGMLRWDLRLVAGILHRS